jgi:hypothetical protein
LSYFFSSKDEPGKVSFHVRHTEFGSAELRFSFDFKERFCSTLLNAVGKVEEGPG